MAFAIAIDRDDPRSNQKPGIVGCTQFRTPQAMRSSRHYRTTGNAGVGLTR
jgi:hypothetical protein